VVNDPNRRTFGASVPNDRVEIVVEVVLSAPQPGSLVSIRLPSVRLNFGGIPGDRHHGLTMRSNSRDAKVYARDTEIRNRRQLTIVSAEECADVARRLRLDRIEPEWLGANALVSGYPHLSRMPAGTRIMFPSGAGLLCEGENLPCRYPGEVIQELHPGARGLVRAFVREAYGRRGIAASVERPGEIRAGDRACVIPVPAYATIT
jgi:hypothetical protein